MAVSGAGVIDAYGIVMSVITTLISLASYNPIGTLASVGMSILYSQLNKTVGPFSLAFDLAFQSLILTIVTGCE